MAGIIFDPTTSWPWKVHPARSSQALVRGFPMSCNRAAHRSQRWSVRGTILSKTFRVCKKLSLCPLPRTVSTPLSRASCGKISSSRPLSSKSRHPFDGQGERMIFSTSVAIRSREMMPIRSRLRRMAAKVSGSIRKSSWVANRMARTIRRGSSEKVVSGSSGVRMSWASMSSIPPNGSTSSPKLSPFSPKAMALMVKSRLRWSSSMVPSSTMGLRESAR